MITAEEFLKSKGLGGYQQFDGVLQEFAKLHVEEALKAASEKAKIEYIEPDGCATWWFYQIDKDSILNSYPLTNIN